MQKKGHFWSWRRTHARNRDIRALKSDRPDVRRFRTVGHVHIFHFCTEFLKKKLETYSYFSESFFGIFSKKSKKKYFGKSWKRTQIWKKIRKLLETYTDFYENIFNFFELFLTFCTFFCKKNILKKVGSVHRFGKKSENCWRRTHFFMKKICPFFKEK